MSYKNKTGILVVGHGSRRAEANNDVRNAACAIRKRGNFEMVEAAFLEIEQPDIVAGFAKLAEQGVTNIIVHPYFLSPGRHTRGDIPLQVHSAALKHAVSYKITEPLSAHPLVIEASVERIRTTEEADICSSDSHKFIEGIVYLVGAGPGDAGLLTVKARDLLSSCDSVVYDNLVNPEILLYAHRHAYRIYAGKIGRGHQTRQEEINQLLITRARAGEKVVRLKGGDPFVYGRGGEEALALTASQIKFEIVPGVSSAIAVPAYSGIPLTHRSLSQSVAILTGSRALDGSIPESITSQAGNAETLVILMGISHLRLIADELISSGRSPETPVAVIRRGTYQSQQTVVGTIKTISDDVERADLRAPAVIVVGEVVRLREHLEWFEKKHPNHLPTFNSAFPEVFDPSIQQF